jgi:hypothetical protein
MCKEDNDRQEVSPWCRIVRQFLVQSTIEQTGYVQEIDSEFCFSCQHKQSTAQVKSTSAGGVPKASPKVIKNGLFEFSKTVHKARQKRRRHQDKYSLKKTKYTPQSSLDGSLYFPFIGILVKSDVNHFDTLSMADQVRYACENGVQHMNITPNNAFYLEQEGFIPEGPAEEIEILHQDFDTSYASPVNPDITIKQKCEVIVIDSIKATILCGATKKTGSNWIDGSEIQKAVEYMSATHVSSAMARNVDLIAIFATPINASSCSFTIIAYATRLHVDTPKVHPFLPLKGFWENKWIIDVPSQSTRDLTQPALGRGGAGRGKFVFAILDHSYDLSDRYAWDRTDRELFHELVRVAEEQGLGGPDALEECALVPALMEVTAQELGDYHLELV